LTLQMEGHGLAAVTAARFHGNAEVIKYDEDKGVIVLQARAGGLATLHLPKRNGATGEIQGMKIYYWIRTGTFKIEGS